MRLLGVERVEHLGPQHVSAHDSYRHIYIGLWLIDSRSTLAWPNSKFTTVLLGWDPCRDSGRSYNFFGVVVLVSKLYIAGIYLNEYHTLISDSFYNLHDYTNMRIV